jgi:predicted peroxiredoxin
MKKLLIFLIPVMGILSCNQSNDKEKKQIVMDMSDSAAACCVRDGVFYHISSGYNNPHKALMPLKMAAMMAMDKDVILYLDIEAVKMVLKDSKDMTFADFPSLKESLKKLIDMKVTIMACPTCLKIAGKTEADLMPGVIIAQKDKFFNFTKGRIITLDY